MKKQSKKNPKIYKGMSSAVLLSILIHAALFLLATLLVVFTVVKQNEVEFEPPKAVERPKMKLKKPKVRIKKSSRPRTARIVSTSPRPSMPDIQLPEMSGMGGDGLGEVMGGFDLMPDLGEVSIFGSGQSIGNDFEGTFYDFKRDQGGHPIPMNDDQFKAAVSKFVRSGFQSSGLARYYRSPKKLYATSIMIPPMLSYFAPGYFGETDADGYHWMVHYKGQLVHRDGGRFRFWGRADDLLIVRLDGRIVLDGSFDDRGEKPFSQWQNADPDTLSYYMGNRTAVVGNWFELEPGIPLNMEVVIGEVPGGQFSAMLVVQEEGVEYEKNRQSGPILPMFKTSEPSRRLVDEILKRLVPGEAGITNGPVFCDYDWVTHTPGTELTRSGPAAPVAPLNDDCVRRWSVGNAESLDAELVATVGDKVVLKTSAGKQLKIAVEQLSAQDREFVELSNPPEFDVEFIKQSSQRMMREQPGRPLSPCRVLDYTFGARLRQRSPGRYAHELRVEYFAIGAEIDGDNYILLDRGKSAFIPSMENERSHSFHGDPVELLDFELDSQRRGTKPAGHLITVEDKRGKIIARSASSEWLLENLENLKQLPLGSYMDKTCTRVYPTSPKANRY